MIQIIIEFVYVNKMKKDFKLIYLQYKTNKFKHIREIYKILKII